VTVMGFGLSFITDLNGLGFVNMSDWYALMKICSGPKQISWLKSFVTFVLAVDVAELII
jgi:hypothetical protein